MPDDHGGKRGETAGRGWIDLSRGISRRPWPARDQAAQAPAGARERLVRAAAGWFGCDPAQVLPVADGPAALLRLPQGRAAVLAPDDSGHAARLRAAGWRVTPVARVEDMAGADLALAVNPGNPHGREWRPDALARQARRVGLLVVDETLADPRPDLSLAQALPANALILRSLSPLWGLRGLDFVLADPALLDRLSGPPPTDAAMHLGAQALADRDWADQAILYLAEAALRLDRLAVAAGWRMAGGTHLFRLYDVGDAAAAQDRLARARIRVRRLPPPDRLLRLDIPGNRAEWDRLAVALRKI